MLLQGVGREPPPRSCVPPGATAQAKLVPSEVAGLGGAGGGVVRVLLCARLFKAGIATPCSAMSVYGPCASWDSLN